MASILKVDEMQGVTSAGDITVTSEGGSATQSLQQGLAKAWGNIEPAATPTLHDSFNMASLTDHGTGEYSTNLTNGMSAIRSVYHSVTGSAQQTSGGDASSNIYYAGSGFNVPTTTTWPMRVVSGTGGSIETGDYAGVGLFGDLA